MSPPGPKCGLCIVAGCRYKFLLEAYLDCVSIHFQGQAARSAFPLFLLTLARRRRRSLRRRNGSRRAWVSPVVNNELGHRARPFGGIVSRGVFSAVGFGLLAPLLPAPHSHDRLPGEGPNIPALSGSRFRARPR